MEKMYMNQKGRCSSLLMFLFVMAFAFSAVAQNNARVRPIVTSDMAFSIANDIGNCNGHTIELISSVYDEDANTTTFTYSVTSGGPPALSHWVIELCAPCSYVVDAGPEPTSCGTDPTTGIFGLKFDTGLDQGETQEFYITLSGEWATGEVRAAVKAGTREHYCTIYGPICEPDIRVEKTALTTTFGAVGNVIEYAIVVTNTGFYDLTNVVVTDDLTGAVFNIATLPVGASQTLSTFYSVVVGDFCNEECMPVVYNEVTATGYYGSEMVSDTDDETVFGVYPGFGPIAGTSDEVACYADIVMPALPEVFDFCGNAITSITGPVVSAVPDCFGDITYTWTYEDCWGNTQEYVHTVTILPPVVVIPDDGSLTVACPSEVIAPAAPVLFDNCERQLELVSISDPLIPECAGEVTFVYTYEDCAGVQYTWNYVVTISDPVVDIPEDGVEMVQCYSDVYLPTAPQLFDNCGRELMVSGPEITEIFDGCEGTVTYTFTYSDCAGVEYDWNFVFHIDDTIAPVLISVVEDLVFECGEEVIIPMPEYSDNCDDVVEVFCGIVGMEGVSCEDYEFPEGDTQIYFYAVDECGNESERTYITVTVEPCIFCTLTQGGYGNAGGKYCDLGTLELLNALLMANDGLTVGYGDRTFTVPATGAQCVINILPGGGKPAALPVGHWSCDNLGNLVNPRTGRLTNNLLSQTIVFQLNLYWSPTMADYMFTSRTFYTSSSSACPDEFNPEPVGTWTMYTFPESVWSLLTADDGKLSMAELLDLANRALGGVNVGVPISAIYEAIDMLNNAFVECAFLSYNPPTFTEEKADDQKLFKVESSIRVNVAPNPFRNHARISFSVEYDTNVVVEVYTFQGAKVATLFENAVKAHEINSVTFNVEGQISRQIYLVVVRTPYGRNTMQMINAR